MTPEPGSLLRIPAFLLFIAMVAAPAATAAPASLLIILSPTDISALQPVVEVRGRVSDPAAKLAWDVPGTTLGGEAALAPDGSFTFRVETEGLHLTQSVRIVARDSAGRRDEQVLLLVDPDPGPLLTLDEPAVSLTEGQGLVVSGRISDPSGGLPTGWLDSLTWSLPPTGRAGVIVTDEAGRFEAVIDGAGLAGRVLWLRAEDSFGHLTLRQVRIGGQKAAVEMAPAAVGGSPIIEISSPAGIGWYRTRLTVEGRLRGPDASEEPLTWNVSGDRGQSGEILVDSDGTFRLELATGDLTGDRLLAFAVHTASGGKLEASVPLRDGRRTPEVRIDSPVNGGEYGSVMQLKGSVTDPYAGIAGMGGFESVSWQMAPLGVASGEEIRSGPVTVSTDGSFDVAIPTRGMAGQQLISVVAVGRSGNRGEAGVRVARGGSDIPSFAAIAGDGAVTLRWDAQAGEARFDLLYANDREVGDGTGAFVVGNVQSPYVIRGLSNGSRYVFRIKAAAAGRPDAWSTEQDAIPLGPGTLKPTAVGEYGGVRLSWASVPGVKSCEVWRSALREDGWALVAFGLAGSSWFDGQAAAGLTWFYRIRPEITGAIASDPTSAAALEFADRALEPAGSLVLAGARAVAVSGAYAWVCCGAGGIRVIDLGDPNSPREVASLPLPDARAIAVAGTVACVADGERGVVLLDVSDPRAPRVTGVRYLQDPRSVAMSLDVAYVACGTGGVRLVDISDPRSPERLGVVASDDARELCLYEGRLLVADAVAGLRVYDLASPAAPRPVTELALAGARGVSARDTRAVVLTAGGFSIVDIGDPARPAVITTIEQTVSCAVMADDGYAIVAGRSGVAVLDAAEPTGRPIDTAPVSSAACIGLADDFACVFDAGSLRLLQIRVLGNPAVLGEAPAAGSANRIAADGGRTFIAARSSGLLVFEVSEIASRRIIRPAGTLGARFAEDVATAGSLAFIADGAAGLRIVAVEPGGSGGGEYRARELSLFQPGGVVHGVSVSGPIVCIAAGAAGVLVLDVTDPAVPRQLAVIPSADAWDVAQDGMRLLVADAVAGLRAFDLAIPASPVEIAQPRVPAVRVSAGKGWALAVSSAGVTVIDWPDIGIPRIAGFYRTEWAEDACRNGDRLLVAEGHRGLTVIDLADPSRQRVVSVRRDLYASAVSTGEGCVLVAGAGRVWAVKILVPPWLER